jgi:hypothetical protein
MAKPELELKLFLALPELGLHRGVAGLIFGRSPFRGAVPDR